MTGSLILIQLISLHQITCDCSLQAKCRRLFVMSLSILDNLVTGCDDIAFVGVVVGGSYAAWKLRNTQQVVTVYEYSDRVGGRLHTTPIKGVPYINV